MSSLIYKAQRVMNARTCESNGQEMTKLKVGTGDFNTHPKFAPLRWNAVKWHALVLKRKHCSRFRDGFGTKRDLQHKNHRNQV